MMRAVLVVALLLAGNILPTGVRATKMPSASLVQANRNEAEHLWELAIAAKGGRERLYAVSNLQISIREKVWYKLRRVPYIEEDLYVFPSKYWEWNDQRKSIFGFSIRVYNQDRDIDLWYTDHGRGGEVGRPVDLVHGKADLITLYDIQLRYLMETKWVRPIPLSVERAKLGGHSVDIVQTVVKGYPTKDGKDEKTIAFALDRQTHLPLQVDTVPLADYTQVGGIEIPSKVYGLRSQCKINVDYNEQIFLGEPNVEGGIEQWKKK